MAFAFDSLAYAKRLRDSGVSQEQAEAHAEAVRDYVIGEVATKADLQSVRNDLQAATNRLSAEIKIAVQQATIRLVIMIGVAAAGSVGAIAAIVKLT